MDFSCYLSVPLRPSPQTHRSVSTISKPWSQSSSPSTWWNITRLLTSPIVTSIIWRDPCRRHSPYISNPWTFYSKEQLLIWSQDQDVGFFLKEPNLLRPVSRASCYQLLIIPNRPVAFQKEDTLLLAGYHHSLNWGWSFVGARWSHIHCSSDAQQLQGGRRGWCVSHNRWMRFGILGSRW